MGTKDTDRGIHTKKQTDSMRDRQTKKTKMEGDRLTKRKMPRERNVHGKKRT